MISNGHSFHIPEEPDLLEQNIKNERVWRCGKTYIYSTGDSRIALDKSSKGL